MKFFVIALAFMTMRVDANNCSGDAKKYCQGIEPGKGQLSKCLSEYEKQLSPDCAKELKEFKKKTGKKNPCFEDLADLCADVPAEGPKIEYCLLKNESRLSDVCSADFKQKKGKILVKNVCAQDVVNVCYSEVSGPEGALNHCLIRNRQKLSNFCQNSVNKRIENMKKGNPCFDDTEKHCPTHVKFIDIQECLEKKTTKLVPECKKLVENEIKKSQANPCYRDLIRHCVPNLSPKDQRACLSLNENVLSNACKQFRTMDDKKVNKMVDACEVDRVKLCPKEPFQDGMVVKCLRKNKAKLTKACAELI